MDVYIKRDYVMQALTYVGTAEATDIIPLTLAAARNNVMKLPCRELEEIISQEIIENAKAEFAREIFEEIEKMMYKLLNDRLYIAADMSVEIAELKKKYTGEKK